MAAKSTTKTGQDPAANEVAETPSDALAPEQNQLQVEVDAMSANAGQSGVMITLDEFLQKLSGRDKRVELVNGFYFTERQSGANKDYESNFQSRFVEFTQLRIED